MNPEFTRGFHAAIEELGKEGDHRCADWSEPFDFLKSRIPSYGAAPEPLGIPVPMRLPCPGCGKLHIDEGDFATKLHHTHACQFCGMVWRPAVIATVGVQFLPGFKNEG